MVNQQNGACSLLEFLSREAPYAASFHVAFPLAISQGNPPLLKLAVILGMWGGDTRSQSAFLWLESHTPCDLGSGYTRQADFKIPGKAEGRMR